MKQTDETLETTKTEEQRIELAMELIEKVNRRRRSDELYKTHPMQPNGWVTGSILNGAPDTKALQGEPIPLTVVQQENLLQVDRPGTVTILTSQYVHLRDENTTLRRYKRNGRKSARNLQRAMNGWKAESVRVQERLGQLQRDYMAVSKENFRLAAENERLRRGSQVTVSGEPFRPVKIFQGGASVAEAHPTAETLRYLDIAMLAVVVGIVSLAVARFVRVV